MSTARPRRPGRTALVALAVVGTLAAGCAPSTPASRDPEPSSSTQEDDMSSDPSAVLALAGLELPADATDATVESKDVPGYHYAYTVTFTAPVASVEQFTLDTVQIPLDDLTRHPGGEPGSRLLDTTLTDLPEGTRYTTRAREDGQGYGNIALVVEGPDLTTVHVGVSSFPG